MAQSKTVKRNPTKTDTLKKAMCDALKQSLGIVTTAIQKVGIHRSTHYSWYNNDPEYRQKVNEVIEVAHDFVESQLYNQIKDGNTTATIFYMKCKMRERGYIEKQEINLNTKRPDLSGMTTDEIRKHLNGNAKK